MILLTDWNIHNTSFPRLCLPGLTSKAMDILMEVKCCRAENSIYLIECLQEQCDQTYIDSCKNTELSHLLQGLVSAKKSAATGHSSSTFTVKRVWIQTLVGLVLWDPRLPCSRPAAFLSKLAIPCSNTLSLNLFACLTMSSKSSDSVTQLLVTQLSWYFFSSF